MYTRVSIKVKMMHARLAKPPHDDTVSPCSHDSHKPHSATLTHMPHIHTHAHTHIHTHNTHYYINGNLILYRIMLFICATVWSGSGAMLIHSRSSHSTHAARPFVAQTIDNGPTHTPATRKVRHFAALCCVEHAARSHRLERGPPTDRSTGLEPSRPS